jgi:hypothetical protein
LVQVCYECGAERAAREFHDDFATERLNHSIRSAKMEVAKLVAPRMIDGSKATATQERLAAGQGSARNFLLVK